MARARADLRTFDRELLRLAALKAQDEGFALPEDADACAVAATKQALALSNVRERVRAALRDADWHEQLAHLVRTLATGRSAVTSQQTFLQVRSFSKHSMQFLKIFFLSDLWSTRRGFKCPVRLSFVPFSQKKLILSNLLPWILSNLSWRSFCCKVSRVQTHCGDRQMTNKDCRQVLDYFIDFLKRAGLKPCQDTTILKAAVKLGHWNLVEYFATECYDCTTEKLLEIEFGNDALQNFREDGSRSCGRT